jgi:hypothetical protein
VSNSAPHIFQVYRFMKTDEWPFAPERPYLAVAVLEPPFDPLKGRYTRSVLAAYASACAILAHLRGLYGRHPKIFEKIGFFGNIGFAAVVMLGSLATTAPGCPLAKSALVEFGELTNQFEAVMRVVSSFSSYELTRIKCGYS